VRTVPLGEIVDFYSGGTPSKSKPEFWTGRVPWFSAKDLKQPRLTESVDHISNSAFDSTSLRKLPAGTIAMVVRGMILAHSVPVSIIDVEAAINQDLKALLPKRDVDISYLAAMLRAQHATILAQVSTAAHGTKKLESRVLERLEIPLPPLPEQRRIAAILDRADAIRTKRRQVLAQLEYLRQTVFLAMFGAPHSWSSLWRMGTIGDLAVSVDYGTSARAGSAGMWPILRMGNITDDGRLDLGDLKYIDLSVKEVPKYTVRPGDLLFNRTNSKEKVGKSAVVRTDQPLALAGYLIRVRFEDVATAEFVSGYLRSSHGIATRRRLAKAAVNQANINATEMRGISIALPPHVLRQSHLERVDAIEIQRDAERCAIAAEDELFASLQSRAFRGEL
jgi:type I restriction enzyme S subunit